MTFFRPLAATMLAAWMALPAAPVQAANIALQIERSASGSVASGANVVFDSVVYSAGNISYNAITGIVTFNEAGRYVVNWWVDYRGTNSTIGSMFAISSSQGDFLEGNSSAPVGQVNGMGIVDVVAAPVTVSLVNGANGTTYYSGITPIKATLVVIQDDTSVVVNPL